VNKIIEFIKKCIQKSSDKEVVPEGIKNSYMKYIAALNEMNLSVETLRNTAVLSLLETIEKNESLCKEFKEPATALLKKWHAKLALKAKE